MVAKFLGDNKSKIHLKSEFALFYSEIRCIARCVLHILGFSVPSIILADFLGNTYLLARVQKVIICDSCDWWISIRFVCFVFQGSLLCDSPVSGNNQLVKFALQIFMIFLILVTWKNKATSASFLKQKIHSPSRFPWLFLSTLESFSAKLGEHYIVICTNPAFSAIQRISL